MDKSVPYTLEPDHAMAATKPLFLSADFRTIAHATEDVSSVEKALVFVVECLTSAKANVTRQYLKGHHGNLITTVSAGISGKELPVDVLGLLSTRLSDSERRFISNHMDSSIDEERNLYLRFDKQEAFLGYIKLHEADPVRVKLKFIPKYDAERIAGTCRENGLIA